ncbi:MAG: response regulator [Nitrospiraceae bacterium]|nr:response regulator [Nitrospiraceae bacterium]
MKSLVHILYLEDEANDVELAGALLCQANIDYEMLHVETRDAFRTALEQQAFDLILADYSLPSFDGLTALAMARKQCPEVPFILVSGQLGEELAIDSLKSGATDYVLKQKRGRLVPAMRRALCEAEEHRRCLRAEAELRRLAVAIDQAAEIIIVTDPEGAIQYANPAFEQVTGFSREEVEGQNPHILKSGKQDRAFYEELWNTISNGEVWSGHFTNMKKDGSLYEEDATISPVRDGSGRIINYVAVKRDVTEQATFERRLRQAQKLEALGTLAGGIAHDFNNLLAAIIGYGEMAAERLAGGSPEQRDLDQALSAAHRAKNLVRQILTFSQQREQERQPVHLHLIVGEALELLRPSLPTTIEIQCTLDKNCGPVNADPTQMHQIIMNLCTNAYHAMKETGGVLSVGLALVKADGDLVDLRPSLPEGVYAKLTVKDAGHGMDGETTERIFDPFFTTKDEGEGAGLGLSTVHGIVKACGGTIAVDSEPGRGTTFDVYLPCAETATKEEKIDDGPIQGGTERVLVVDDEETLAELIGRQLQVLGYDVTVRTSSVEALQDVCARPHHFDLIIIDDIMPKMTGRQLIREGRRFRKDIPVISISGADEETSSEEAEKSGIRMFLKKPFSHRVLASAVRNVLNETKAENTSVPARSETVCARYKERKS